MPDARQLVDAGERHHRPVNAGRDGGPALDAEPLLPRIEGEAWPAHGEVAAAVDLDGHFAVDEARRVVVDRLLSHGDLVRLLGADAPRCPESTLAQVARPPGSRNPGLGVIPRWGEADGDLLGTLSITLASVPAALSVIGNPPPLAKHHARL